MLRYDYVQSSVMLILAAKSALQKCLRCRYVTKAKEYIEKQTVVSHCCRLM